MPARKKNDCMKWSCCWGPFGLIHLLGGVGLGFLLAYYFNLTDLLLWGWLLVLVGILGHFLWKMKKY